MAHKHQEKKEPVRLRPARLSGDAEKAFRVVSAKDVVVEDDGVHRPSVHEQDSDRPGVDDGVAGEIFHPGLDPGVLLDEQTVPQQPPLLEQVIDKILSEIHQFMDRRLNRWSRHKTMVLPGTDRIAEPIGVSCKDAWPAQRRC